MLVAASFEAPSSTRRDRNPQIQTRQKISCHYCHNIGHRRFECNNRARDKSNGIFIPSRPLGQLPNRGNPAQEFAPQPYRQQGYTQPQHNPGQDWNQQQPPRFKNHSYGMMQNPLQHNNEYSQEPYNYPQANGIQPIQVQMNPNQQAPPQPNQPPQQRSGNL